MGFGPAFGVEIMVTDLATCSWLQAICFPDFRGDRDNYRCLLATAISSN